MTFQEAERLLLERQMFGIKLGLSNIRKALKKLGNPEKRFKSIHIAGTNGKGSTAAILESVLRQCGCRTGLYTSPHISTVLERFKTDGRMITESQFADLYESLIPLMEEIPLTYFECTTAMAFRYFAEKKIEIAVVETGLGGRFDATNVVNPECSIITSIGYDHQIHLGDTLASITKEKCGIIKKNRPVVSGVDQPFCENIIREKAEQRKAPFYSSREEVKVSDSQAAEHGTVFNADFNGTALKELLIPLRGKHQLKNVRTAMTALAVLGNSGIKIDRNGIKKGLRQVTWPERLQQVYKNPPVYIDVAHNEAGFKALAQEIRQLFPEWKVILLAGISAEKDWQNALRPVVSQCDYLAGLPVQEWTGDVSDSFESFLSAVQVPGKMFSTIGSGINFAIRRASGKTPVFYAGSHYIVDEVKKIINSLDRL